MTKIYLYFCPLPSKAEERERERDSNQHESQIISGLFQEDHSEPWDCWPISQPKRHVPHGATKVPWWSSFAIWTANSFLMDLFGIQNSCFLGWFWMVCLCFQSTVEPKLVGSLAWRHIRCVPRLGRAKRRSWALQTSKKLPSWRILGHSSSFRDSDFTNPAMIAGPSG